MTTHARNRNALRGGGGRFLTGTGDLGRPLGLAPNVEQGEGYEHKPTLPIMQTPNFGVT